MNPEIERRIREVYLDGRLEYVNAQGCNITAAKDVMKALKEHLLPVNASLSDIWLGSNLERVMHAVVTLNSASKEFWDGLYGGGKKDGRLEYLHSQEGVPWAQCCISVSTVYPAYEIYFNLIYPSAPDANNDKGIFRTECPRHYDAAPWPEVVAAIHAACQSAGFVLLPDEELNEEVPFITQADWDYGEDDDDLEEEDLPRNSCNVAQCLFQGW